MPARPTAPAMTPAMAIGVWLMLVVLGLIWGGSFFFNSVAVASLPPLTVVFLRVLVAALALLAVCRLGGIRLPRRRSVMLALLFMGIANNAIPFTLIVWGQTVIASGLASILNATTPMFTVLVAHLATHDEKMTPAKLAGILVGFAGVALMFGTNAYSGALSGAGDNNLAKLAVLAAALSYGIAAVFGRRFGRLGVQPLATATGQLLAASLVLAPVWLFVDRPWALQTPTTAASLSVLGLALACTAFAYVLYFRILERAGATKLSLVTFLVPASAILLGALILGEQLAAHHYAGLALIFLGLAILDGRLLPGGATARG